MPTDLPQTGIGAPSWRAIGWGFIALAVLRYRMWRLRRHLLAGEHIQRKIEER